MKKILGLIALSVALLSGCGDPDDPKPNLNNNPTYENTNTDPNQNQNRIDIQEENNNQTPDATKSKSGSRLVFKEHKLSDGTIYIESTAYDTLLETNCNFQRVGSNFMCCIPSLPSFQIGAYSSIELYDETCSEKLPKNVEYLPSIYNCLNVGSFVMSSEISYCPTTIITYKIFKIISKIDSVQVKYGSICSDSNLKGITIKQLSDDELKEEFICEINEYDSGY